MSTGVALMWPAVTVLAFLALTCLVVVLGTRSTARYEFERNGAREQRPAGRPDTSAHPAGRRAATPTPDGPGGQPQPQAVGVAVRPVEPAVGRVDVGWWLVDADDARAVAGPFRDQVDAEWAAFDAGLLASVRYGVLRPDGEVVRRPSPQERAWLVELGDQLDRLPKEWETVLSDTDPLTTLMVEVTAALVEAGLPVHDSAAEVASGGVCLLPALGQGGVLVSWRPHDRMSLLHKRGADVDADVRFLMGDAVAGILEQTGFVVGPFGDSGAHLVTAIRT